MYHMTGKKLGHHDCGIRHLKGHPHITYVKGKGWLWARQPVSGESLPRICPRCLKANDLIRVECAACRKHLGFKEGKLPDDIEDPVSHSLCPTCANIQMSLLEDMKRVTAD